MASVATNTKIRKQFWATVKPRDSGVARALLAIAYLTVAACVAFLAASPAARAADFYWTGTAGTGGNGTWSNVNMWSTVVSTTTPRPLTGPTAVDNVIFGITSATNASTVTLTADAAARSLTQSTLTAGNLTLVGNGGATDRSLTIGPGGMTVPASRGVTVGTTTGSNRVNLFLDGSQTWSAPVTGNATAFTINNGLSRVAGDTTNRTLAVDVGTSQQSSVNFVGFIQDGGSSGSLGLWTFGPGTTNLSGTNTYTGRTTISGGRLSIGANSLLTSNTLALRGSGDGSNGGVLLGTGSFATPKIVAEAGATVMGWSTSGTANLGTISRTGGTVLFNSIGSGTTTYFVANSNNSAGILGAWALSAFNSQNYVTVSGGTLALATLTNASESGWTSLNGVYQPATTSQTLSASRSAYVIAGNVTISLGSNDLTVSGFNGAITVRPSASGTGTGRLVIGSDNELVLGGRNNYTISVPIVDGTAAGKLTWSVIQTASGLLSLTLSGSNSYTGGTDLSANMGTGVGTVYLNNAYALGTGAVTINSADNGRSGLALANTSGAAITLATNNAQVWNSNIQFTGTNDLNMGTGTVSLGVTPQTNRTVTVTANKLTIGGRIMNGSHPDLPTTALTKAGAGVLELSGSNTFTGGFTISAGTLGLNHTSALGTGTAAFTGNSTLLAGITGTVANAVSVSSGVVATLDTQSNNLRLSGGVGGSGGLTKLGSGRLQLTAVNTYSGTTTVSAGQFLVDGAGSLATAGVVVNGSGAELKWNSSNALSAPLMLTQGTLSGTGSISSTGGVSIGTNATLSPGNSPGSQAFTTGLTLASGGTYLWEIGDWIGSAGSGYDQLVVSGGALDISATSGSPFTINITSLTGTATGPVSNWSNTSKTFTIATALSGGGVTNFIANKFSLNSTQFVTQNPSATGTWSITATGSTLLLNYDAPVTTTTGSYSLSASAGAGSIIVGGTSTITATVTNTGAGTADTLNYNTLAVGNGVTISPSTGSNLAQGASGTGTGAFTTLTAGTYTLTPTATVSNATLGGAATQTGTTSATVTVYAHSNGSLAGGPTPVTSDTISLGEWNWQTNTWTVGTGTLAFSLFNLASTSPASLTAALDVTGTSSSGNAGFTTNFNLASYSLIAGGSSANYYASFTPSGTTSGTFTATFTFNTADLDLPGKTAGSTLTLTATVVVVPEPATVVLAGVGIAAAVLTLRRRRA